MTVSKLPELHARLKIQINNLVDLSTVAAKQNSNRSWVKIHSALWGSIQSALTAGLHRDLKQRFSVLEISILSGSDDDSAWQAHEIERLRIEQDEPPIFRVLDLLCHNEMLTAYGHKRDSSAHFASLSAWKRATRHIFHWADSNPV